MTIRLGCIADDFTGATDLANNLVRAGMRVVQTIGVPAGGAGIDDVDAVVVALKSRTTLPGLAVAQSLAACRWLKANGAEQIYFKICSTFDSTPRGNIGPVLGALMDELGCSFTIATPAFPDNGRTVFKGHLFVGDVLLSDSGMRHHPLTPMTDANLVHVLQAQLASCSAFADTATSAMPAAATPSRAPRRVGLLGHRATGDSVDAIRARIAALQADGVAIAIADAIDNDDLVRLGAAVRGMPVVCAGSGLAIGLAANFGIVPRDDAGSLPAVDGHCAIVSGSCSDATRAQVARFEADGGAARRIDAADTMGEHNAARIDDIARWADGQWRMAPERPVLIYSTAAPAAVSAAQAHDVGIGDRVEAFLAGVASALVAHGARSLVIAGGETSGACVQALSIERLRIGRQIDPGVPWCHATSPHAPDGMHLALKSGNFGGDDFFTRAFAVPT